MPKSWKGRREDAFEIVSEEQSGWGVEQRGEWTNVSCKDGQEDILYRLAG